MKRILLIADSDKWIFARHCSEIKARLPEFSFDIVCTFRQDPGSLGYGNYDVIYSLDPGMRMSSPPPERTIIGLRNQFMYDPKNPTPFFDRKIRNCCRVFHVVNVNQLKHFKLIDIPNNISLLLVPHGVDTKVFVRTEDSPNREFTVGFSGNSSSKGQKGVEIMQRVCLKNGIKFIQSGKNLTKEQMPSFYSKIDVYLCMSATEGLNNSSLEAGAMGIPVISTRSGAAEEIIENGSNGLLVDRTDDSLEKAIILLRDNRSIRETMGEKLKNKILEEWSWDKRIDGFRNMFTLAMEK